MKKILLVIALILQFTTIFAQVKTEIVDKQIIEKIKQDDTFKDAVLILTESKTTIDFSKATMHTFNKESFEVRIPIIDKSNSYDYKVLVVGSKKSEMFTYFDEKNGKSVMLKGLFKCSWSGWTKITNMPNECHDNWWCWSKKQEATYYWEMRVKTCNGVVKKVQYRLCKDTCGC